MKVVIDIDKEKYEWLKENNPKADKNSIVGAIVHGTPLPKECDMQRIIPKRVDVQKWIYTECPNPNCNCELSTHHGDGYYSIEHKPDFCPNCGQALLWESEDKT